MSTASESSESEHTLPRPELNPLLNPTLAEHMGRWAEVYFTSPPEKREEAVLELLRELEAGNNGRATAAPAAEGEPKQATPGFSPAEETRGVSSARIRTPSVRCNRCGHDNPVTHQFCGMCGASFTQGASQSFRTDSPYGQHTGEMESVPGRVPETAYEAVHEPGVDEPPPAHYTRRSDPYDLSMLQGLREREIDDYEYEERSSPPYRFYIGAVLAMLLVLLSYMAWRSGQTPQASHQASAPPPPAATENIPAPPSSPAPAATAAPSNPPKATGPAASASSNGAVEAPRPATAENPNTKPLGVGMHPQASPVPSPATSAEPPLTEGSGAAELATAERYLTGSSGQGRNSAEAAKWLWKAMAKHNGPATLQLADLYLKGDGVPKNCDQARVLLDSAAIRGMKGAGERLRNLQAFGCQ